MFKVDNGFFHNSTIKDKLVHFIEVLNRWLEKLLNKTVVVFENEETKGYLVNYAKKLGNIILKYDDENIKDLSTVVADEISEMVNNNEDFSDADLKKGVKYYLGKLKSMEPSKLRSKIKKIIHKKYENLRNHLRNINKFYNEQDYGKLKEITVKVEKLPRSQRKIKKITRDVFDVLFYEKYDSLNRTSKGLFIKEIKKLFSPPDYDTRRLHSDVSSLQSNEELEINATITI